MKLAFVCVGNAGRSQMAAALAERERDRRGLNAAVISGGVDPADSVHDEVVDALREEGIDIGDRAPRRIAPDDIADADYVVTMGCSVDQFAPDGWTGESRVWDLGAGGTDEQLAEIRERVAALFDEIEAERRSEE
ncbi:low molecular weight phosphatase family protein [Halostella sp. JP-L12]|uniref:arsenate-mycothiol transferase ArsC n=1 Tax=Halostella TaxID=1843185 RepID=UPI000EF77215|nr:MULTISPECIES: low molecular weight phosphatase family protein [Halostella]NHN47247.1 low molecular weight phosphatase family protein [Halostella sp. JP-L12]